MKWRKVLRVTGLVVLLALVAAQFVPVERGNPPVETDIAAPPEVAAILRRACYDCHSNETVWPWYGWVAPASWLLEKDVRDGRGELNFSTWNRYDARRAAHKLHEVVEQTESGEMPLWFYLPLHPSAALSEADLATLAAWVAQVAPQTPRDNRGRDGGRDGGQPEPPR